MGNQDGQNSVMGDIDIKPALPAEMVGRQAQEYIDPFGSDAHAHRRLGVGELPPHHFGDRKLQEKPATGLRVNDERAGVPKPVVQDWVAIPANAPQNRLGGLNTARHGAGYCGYCPACWEHLPKHLRGTDSAGRQGHFRTQGADWEHLSLGVPDNQGNIGPVRGYFQSFQDGGHWTRDVQIALARITELTEPVGTTSRISKLALASNSLNCASVRSAPPVITSMFKSNRPPAPDE